MSRVGKKPIEIPAGVTITLNNQTVTVKGPKGELTRTFNPDITINVEENLIDISRPSDVKNTAHYMVQLVLLLPTWLKVFLKVSKEV